MKYGFAGTGAAAELFFRTGTRLLYGSFSSRPDALRSTYNRRMNPEVGPNPVTESALAGVLEELMSREPIFHRREWGTTRADFERMTATDFWEVGASGRRYSRGFVLDEVERRYATPDDDPLPETMKTSEFHCRRLAGQVYLLTYTLLQGERRTRRSTIWENTAEGWKIIFHQGTVVQDT